MRVGVEELLKYETPLWARGVVVAGVDEVGRGPLAGPVVAACVVLPPTPLIQGVYDSKKLTVRQRERLAKAIEEIGIVGIGQVEAPVIDRINILQATRLAMADAVRAVGKTHYPISHVLIDGRMKLELEYPCTEIVHGDTYSYLVGAASIVAKVYRDELMKKLHAQYPQYGFDHNKGYGTAMHIDAIRTYGASALHRISFLRRIL